MLLCFMFLSFSLIAQEEDKKTVLFESIILDPDLGSLSDLADAMAAHNKKYHPEGAHQASVYRVVTGPNAGKLIWMMGPLTWSDLDNRPAADGHDEDWVNNVLPHIKESGHVEYWARDNDLSAPLSETQFPMYYLRYHNIEKGQGHKINDLFTKISNTIKSIDAVNSWSVYDNTMRQGSAGRHMVTVSGMNNWAEMDDDWKFKDHFEKLYGAGSMTGFNLEMMEATSDSWDEIWAFDAYMSGRGDKE